MDSIERKKLQDELDALYIRIGDNDPDWENLCDKASEFDRILNPVEMFTLPTHCTCNRKDCWECVHKDDPMGI